MFLCWFFFFQNYIPELLREDIPQALRGQRNVIFGNVEKIYEFHSQYFLQELERCENSPLFVGQCFLRHVSCLHIKGRDLPSLFLLHVDVVCSFGYNLEQKLG
jgi:hypothetical protein